MVFLLHLIKQKRWQQWTNVPPLLAILIAMAVWWCNTTCIAQQKRSRAFIKATKHHHRATTHSELPQQPPGWQITKWRCNMNPLCWPFWWPWPCAGTLPRTLPDGVGPWLSEKSWNAAIGRALAPILPIGHANAGCFFDIIVKKGSSCVDPLIPSYGQTIPRSASCTCQHHLNVARELTCLSLII